MPTKGSKEMSMKECFYLYKVIIEVDVLVACSPGDGQRHMEARRQRLTELPLQ